MDVYMFGRCRPCFVSPVSVLRRCSDEALEITLTIHFHVFTQRLHHGNTYTVLILTCNLHHSHLSA